MGSSAYFLDSYALIESIKDNKNFKKFEETTNFTSIMNLLETHYRIVKSFGSKKADNIIEELKYILINVTIDDIKKASKFRNEHTKNKFSYIDCLGYIMAINRKLKFVTGDKEFKDLENVEFVK